MLRVKRTVKASLLSKTVATTRALGRMELFTDLVSSGLQMGGDKKESCRMVSGLARLLHIKERDSKSN